MFENYTEKARRTIFFARYEASQYGSRHIEIPHLLLGLVRECKSIFQMSAEIEPGVLQQTIQAFCTRLPQRAVFSEENVPFSDRLQQALTYAAEEAQALGHEHIGTEHLLLGTLRENGPEVEAVARLGFRLDAIREDMAAETRLRNSRKIARELLTMVPEQRLKAAIRLLEGLSSEFFNVSGASSAGPFAFSFGKEPNS